MNFNDYFYSIFFMISSVLFSNWFYHPIFLLQSIATFVWLKHFSYLIFFNKDLTRSILLLKYFYHLACKNFDLQIFSWSSLNFRKFWYFVEWRTHYIMVEQAYLKQFFSISLRNTCFKSWSLCPFSDCEERLFIILMMLSF